MNALLFALTLGSASGPAADGGELGALADREYRTGCENRGDAAVARPHFALAAPAYRQLWESGAKSAELARRWARSEFLAGHLPGAIAVANAGLRVAPHHAGLQRDLETYRDSVIPPASFKPDERLRPARIAGVRARITAWDLFWLATFASATLGSGLARRFTAGDSRAWPVAVVGAALLIACGGIAWKRSAEVRGDLAAPVRVVRSEEVLRKGNGETHAARIDSPLPRGAEVREIARRGGWVQVQLSGGAIGWLPESALVAVP